VRWGFFHAKQLPQRFPLEQDFLKEDQR